MVVEDQHGEVRARRLLGVHDLRLLAPTAELAAVLVKAETPVDLVEYVNGSDNPLPFWVEIELTFRDAGGRDWVRTPSGELLLVQDGNAHD